VRVPGCHDAFGGALGSTYQCQYVHVQHRKTFDWSAEREETFRIANLSAPSGTYGAGADCAHEDEYGELFLESGIGRQRLSSKQVTSQQESRHETSILNLFFIILHPGGCSYITFDRRRLAPCDP
jgi:hypothetical protein